MNKSVWMIMGGAFVIAIIVAMLVQLKVGGKSKSDAAARVEVLVAKRHITAGEVLKPVDTLWLGYPDTLIFKGTITRKGESGKVDAYGKQLRRDLEPGEPVTMQAIVGGPGGGSPLSSALAPGMRAVAVSVKAETMAGGFISPGDYVDVMLSYQISLRGEAEDVAERAVQRFASETLLSNVKVLAIDQDSREGRAAKPGRTVTLEVDKKGAEVIAVASSMGDMSLALRRFGEKNAPEDQQPMLTTDVTTSKVMQAIYSMSEQSKAKTETDNTVRVYSGGAVSNVQVRK